VLHQQRLLLRRLLPLPLLEQLLLHRIQFRMT
jgi:hypothetical protein